MAEKLVCIKCGRSKRETDFFKMKTGDRCDMCKDCLTMQIDNYKPESFSWILEKFDVPYIEKEWTKIVNREYMKNPGKFGPKSVIGFYLRSMNMSQYKDYHYSDSDRLNYEEKKHQQAAEAMRAQQADQQEELREKLERGEISQAEYDTLSFDTPSSDTDVTANFVQPLPSINEDTIRESLTDDDYKYLLNKWGMLYKPSQLLKMEETYQRYAAEYELNTDREEILLKICKISMKMDEALDTEDIKEFKDLSTTFDQLRKSGKFTEAQNKEEQKRELDSIGELVAFVEREGGVIPCYEDPIEYPKDKVDFTIRDMQNYTNRLVKEELGLTDIIETFIERMEKQKNATVEDIMSTSFSEEDEQLTLQDSQDFNEFILKEIEEEAARLTDAFGGDETLA